MSEKLGPIENTKKLFLCNKRIDNELIDKLFSYLISVIKENKKLKNYKEIVISQENLPFNSKDFLYLSLKDYLIYIQEFNDIENYIFIASIIYLERFCNSTSVILTEYNIHKLLFTSILLSIKNYEDFYNDNFYYSKIIGLQNSELNKLEYYFISSLDFNLFIKKSEFEKFKKYLHHFNDNIIEKL